MKLNNKVLALLLVFIAILSVSAVSAAEITDDVAIEASIDADDTLAATHEIAADASMEDIVAIINGTSAGDTLNFAENATYDFGENSDPIEITHTLILQGNGATIKGYQGFLFQADEESVAGSQVYNLNFEVFQPTLWNGRALDFEQGSDYTVDGCSFKNGNSGIYVRRAAGNVTLQNNKFFADDGATNQSTITGNFAKQETGSKAINLMGGSGIKIINNTFEGDLLDAMSIASGAANVEMYDNYANSVWYGVFYGGGITNITMKDNTFENSKAFALGIIKAAGNSEITENTFITPEGKSAIYVEEGNTAHGAPSKIETILIYENEFLGAGSTAVSSSSQGGMITPKGEFKVVDNVYEEGVTVFTFNDNNTYTFTTDNFVTDNNVTIEGNIPMIGSKFVIEPVEGEHEFGYLGHIMLLGEDNTALADQNISILITTGDEIVEAYNATTDSEGMCAINLVYDVGEYQISVLFEGAKLESAYYGESDATGTFTIYAPSAIIVGENATITTKAKQRFEITLKDENNVLLTNKTVQFTINGVTYNRTTNENGIAGLNINLNMGDYNMGVAYTDDAGNLVNDTYVLTAVQSNTTIKSTPVTFQGKGNKFTAKLVDQLGQPLADKAVAFHINGVAYYRVTDANGEFGIGINLNPGIYNMYMSFDGTLEYAASNGGSEITVV